MNKHTWHSLQNYLHYAAFHKHFASRDCVACTYERKRLAGTDCVGCTCDRKQFHRIIVFFSSIVRISIFECSPVTHELILPSVCARRAYPRRFLGRVGRTPLSPTLTWRRFQMPSRKGVKNRLYSTDAYQWCDGQDPSVSLECWSFSFIAIAFFMSYTYSFDYEIMQLPDTGGIPCVLSNVTT